MYVLAVVGVAAGRDAEYGYAATDDFRVEPSAPARSLA
jgi:hypothetical protein